MKKLDVLFDESVRALLNEISKTTPYTKSELARTAMWIGLGEIDKTKDDLNELQKIMNKGK